MTPDSNSLRNPRQSSAADVCLLLRAHGESRWLSNELTPVLREVEQRETISERQLATALAYLEVLWIEACARARETESARVELHARRLRLPRARARLDPQHLQVGERGAQLKV